MERDNYLFFVITKEKKRLFFLHSTTHSLYHFVFLPVSHDLSFFKKTRHRKQNRLRQILFWILGIVFLYVCAILFSFVEVSVHAQDAIRALKQAKADAFAMHFEETHQSLQDAENAFLQAKQFFPFLQTASILPVVGSSVAQSNQLIVAGLDVVTSLRSVSDIGQDVLQLSGLNEQYFKEVQQGKSPPISFSDLSPQTRQLILTRLEASSNKFSFLSKQIALVSDELNDILRRTGSGPLSETMRSAQAELVQTQFLLQQASLFTNIIPAFSGVNKTAHHLILLLNNTELRPGGGFVGNYGIATVTKGAIDSVKTADVYALDRLTEGKEKEAAPYPLSVYNQTPIWYLRDANWSPDFSVSAQKVIQKFQEETSLISLEARASIPYADTIDGVIAFTPTFASQILKLTGPIVVSGQTFTSENISDKLEYQVEYGYAKQGIPEAQRKEIIGQLMDAVTQKMSEMPISEWGSVLAILEDAFSKKHFFLYHTNPDVEQVITHAGWSGNVTVGEGHAPPVQMHSDVQLVVDANMASLKTDPVVDRTISYQIVTGANGERIGRTSITYHHTGSFDWKTSRYRTYTRLYVPLGSTLIRVIGALKNDQTQNPNKEAGTPDVSSELGMTVFGAFIAIEPGATGTLTFEYTLADSVRSLIANNTYVLKVLKQNGARDHALTLDLNFGKNVLRAIPPEDTKEWGDTRYQLHTILDQDKEFNVGM